MNQSRNVMKLANMSSFDCRRYDIATTPISEIKNSHAVPWSEEFVKNICAIRNTLAMYNSPPSNTTALPVFS